MCITTPENGSHNPGFRVAKKYAPRYRASTCHSEGFNQGALTSSPRSFPYAMMLPYSDLMLCGHFYHVIAEVAHYHHMPAP